MNAKKSERITVILFCGFLFVMILSYLLLPKEDFSENEKRYLSKAPALSWEAVSSGDWGDAAETYMADHIPGRDFFVGLNAYFDLYTGRQVAKDIVVLGDRLVEDPEEFNIQTINKNMTYINGFAQNIGQSVDFIIVPSAGWAAGLEDYQDEAIIDYIYKSADSGLNTIDVLPVFDGNVDLYYKTDHHWNSTGAHEAYTAYMDAIEKEYRNAEDFDIEVCEGFQGSTYSRSALWLTPAEDLELWHGSNDLTVTNGETDDVHEGVFYRERLEEADKYTVYLDGNHSTVRIHNPNAEGKLLVIRDSYSNSLGCFLAESYEEVVLVDLRYYKQPISELVQQEHFNNILICYSIGNFLTDTNISWLR